MSLGSVLSRLRGNGDAEPAVSTEDHSSEFAPENEPVRQLEVGALVVSIAQLLTDDKARCFVGPRSFYGEWLETKDGKRFRHLLRVDFAGIKRSRVELL